MLTLCFHLLIRKHTSTLFVSVFICLIQAYKRTDAQNMLNKNRAYNLLRPFLFSHHKIYRQHPSL